MARVKTNYDVTIIGGGTEKLRDGNKWKTGSKLEQEGTGKQFVVKEIDHINKTAVVEAL